MTAPAKPPVLSRRRARWVKQATEVAVYVAKLGYVRVSKRVAVRLLRHRGRALTAEFVPGLDLLLLHPRYL